MTVFSISRISRGIGVYVKPSAYNNVPNEGHRLVIPIYWQAD